MSAPADAPVSGSAAIPSGEDQTLRAQRELALACAWLALTLSLAVLLTNFGREPAALVSARQAVEAHRRLLAGQEENLRVNEAVLRQNRATLANVKKAVHP